MLFGDGCSNAITQQCCPGLVCGEILPSTSSETVCLANGCKGLKENCVTTDECCTGLVCTFMTELEVNGCYYRQP